jgi:RNA polymerase sigma-70 factor (ECF subfamily)
MDQNNLDLESLSILVPLAKDGNKDAQNQILKQVQDVLTKLARQQFQADLRQRQNPSDVVQLTLTRMINGFDDFRGTTENELYAWMKTILKNELHVARRHQQQAKRDARRDRKQTDNSDAPAYIGGVDPELTPSSEAINKEKVQLLRNAMSRLSPEFQQVIQLRSLEEKPFQEIAEIMNKSYDAVAKIWQRAVVQLENELAEREID